MKLCIIGNGNFGSFLRSEFYLVQPLYREEIADTFILAIPASEYGAAAKDLTGKYGNRIHLVNVCSVQEDTTNELLRHGCPVTAIHPLFGPRSSTLVSERISIVTYPVALTQDNQDVIDLFSKISMIRIGMSGVQHDKYMAKTHYQVVKIADRIAQIVSEARTVPDYMLTPSFKKMRELYSTLLDMPAGTRDSILSNKYAKEQ